MSAPLVDQAGEIATLKVQVRKLQEFHASDFWGNSCVWVVFALLFAAAIALIFAWPFSSSYPYHHHQYPVMAGNGTPPTFYMKHASRRQHSRASCTVGEQWDPQLSLCSPQFKAPLALDATIMNATIRPCDSFYTSMCGRFIDSHTNENRAFSYGWRRTRARLALLLGPNSTSPKAQSAQAFYQACLRRGLPGSQKEAAIEFAHLRDWIVNPVRTHADLSVAFGRLARLGYTGPFALSMERHPLEPRVLPFWSPDGFPSALLDEGKLFQLLQKWRSLTQYTSMQENHLIEGVLSVSRQLAMHRGPDPNVTDYSAYLQGQFARDLVHMSDFVPSSSSSSVWSWDRYFQTLDGNGLRFELGQQFWSPDSAYLKWLIVEDGFQSIAVTDWRAFLEFSILYNGNEFDPALPDNVYFRQHDVFGPIGKQARFYHRLPRSVMPRNATEVQSACISLTEHMVPGLVAAAYLERWMPERVAVRERAFVMVTQLVESLKRRVSKTPWLSDADRTVLQQKLGSILVRVAEPEEWTPEPFGPSLSVDRHDHNMNLVRRYRVQRNLALWHKDSGATWWSRAAMAFFAMPLTEVNAYYSGPSNSITVLAGVLQSPFFNLAYNEVSQWAILGSIIGHELSHSLDHHGLRWDAQGNYVPGGILSAEGMRQFYQEIVCVVREYGPAPAGCESANAHYGNSTIGEDLADLTGISLAYETLFGQPNNPGTVGDKQHFFMILAQAFCETYDQPHRCAAVAHDVHAVAEFRIDRTFRNLPAWAEVFGCPMDEEQVCRVY